jgi:hypothetical protein
LQPVTPDSAYDAELDENQILSFSELKHDQKVVINNIAIYWNFIDSLNRFTKISQLVDSTSIGKHGLAKLVRYKFKGVFTGVHSDNDIANYFRTIRDRYANPPLRMTVQVMPEWDRLDVGDTVRIVLPQVIDFNTDTGLDRTFEIQQVRTNWQTGVVTLDLFGGISQTGDNALSATNVLQDSYYTETGVGITELSTAVTIVGGIMTVSGTITGGQNNDSNIFYYDGDLEIQNGVTLTVERNVLLRVKGFLTVNGEINCNGLITDAGGIGVSNSGWAANMRQSYFGKDLEPRTYAPLTQLGNNNALSAGLNELPVYNLLNEDGTGIEGVPTNICGQPGSTGKAGNIHNDIPTSDTPVPGGAGGAGGGGLVIVCRGMTIGLAGTINTDGVDGTVGSSAGISGKTLFGQTGSGGYPGGFLVLIDGNFSTPSFSATNFSALRGKQSPDPSVDVFADGSDTTVSVGEAGYGQRVTDNRNLYNSVSRVQYIPEPKIPFVWLPGDEVDQVSDPGNAVPPGGDSGQILVVDENGNHIWVFFGDQAASSEYFPGYPYVFIDADEWRIAGQDVTRLFSPGRRLKFVDGTPNVRYGQITTATFTAGNTNFLMAMESAAVLDANIVDVGLTVGVTGWTPIAQDPFQGTQINAIKAGYILGVKHWIAIGNTGKAFYSTDAGNSWAACTGFTTTENLNDIDYNDDLETFIVVGNGGVVLRSTDGVSFTLDTAEIAAITTTGNGNCLGVRYDKPSGEWILGFHRQTTSAQYSGARSVDDGVNWTLVSAIADSITRFYTRSITTDAEESTLTGRTDDVLAQASPAVTWTLLDSATAASVSAICSKVVSAANRYFIGRTDGSIEEGVSGAIDDVTFGGSRINDITYSALHGRFVAVADDGKVGYLNDADVAVADAWTLVGNNFNVTAKIRCIHYDDNDGMFVAGADNGQICRDANGLDD